MELTDKNSEMQVIGCLMQNPLLFAEIDKYHFDVRDFSNKFTKIIFSSINNLYLMGIQSIGVIDIDNYLKNYPDLKVTFEKENGIAYLQDCEEIVDLNNFPYYYGRLKKFSCLRNLSSDGFDVSNFYPDSVLEKDYSEKIEKFDNMKISDIFESIKKNLFSIEERYISAGGNESGAAADGMLELKNSLKVTPEIGAPLQGEIFNTIVKGARKGKYYLRSAGTGVGKSRLAVGDACNLAFPIYYDWNKREWVKKYYCEKSLFITTELDKEEIQTLILAWVSGVNEDVIISGSYTFEQESIVDKAIEFIQEYKDNFIIQHIPDPSIGQIESIIRKQVLVNNIQNVFYDYIFTSPSLLTEFSASKIREDVALMMLSTSLKDLAVELNIYMASATQITGTVDDNKGPRDQRYIRGAKSISDKCDVGYITVNVVGEELKIIEPLIMKLGLKMPNMVTDIYKVRRGRYKSVKIWSYADLGTCRLEDIIITDGYYNPISNFTILKYEDLSKPKEETVEIEKVENETVKKKLRDLF